MGQDEDLEKMFLFEEGVCHCCIIYMHWRVLISGLCEKFAENKEWGICKT